MQAFRPANEEIPTINAEYAERAERIWDHVNRGARGDRRLRESEEAARLLERLIAIRKNTSSVPSRQ